MNGFYIIGLVVGLIVGLGIAAVAIRFCRGKWTWRSKYDERQKVAMGKAYRDGFWTLLAAGFVAVMISKCGLEQYLDEMLLAAGFIGLDVYIIGCIMRDAYMGLTDKPKRWTAVIALAGVFNILIAVMNFARGAYETPVVNLTVGIFALTAAAAYIIRQAMIRNEMESEDGEDI